MIKIRLDTGSAMTSITGQKSKAHFAMAVALTKTAQSAQSILASKSLQNAFDRPTPFTLKSTFIRPARPNTLVSSVSFKDRQISYIGLEVTGGARQSKAFERALQSAGAMPAGYICVAGQGAPLDAFGNVPRNYIVEMLRQLSGTGSYGGADLANERRRKRGIKKFGRFTVIPPGTRGLHAGIYQRLQFGFGTGIRPVFIFVKKATYQPLLNLQPVADEAVATALVPAFTQAFSS